MKGRLHVSLAVVLVGSLIGWIQYANAQRSGAAVQRWEYRISVVPTIDRGYTTAFNEPAARQLLSEAGADGWELVAVGNNFYFKRPK
jgi:hypothetical protein